MGHGYLSLWWGVFTSIDCRLCCKLHDIRMELASMVLNAITCVKNLLVKMIKWCRWTNCQL